MKRFRFLFIFIFLGTNAVHAANPYLFNHSNPKGINYLARLASALHLVLQQPNYDITAEHNGDDTNVAGYAGSFSKALEHDGTTGLLTTDGQTNYALLLAALTPPVLQSNFNAIVRAPGATRKFVNPQASFALSLVGCPSALIAMPSAPTLSSAQAAAGMIEVYLKMLCRNVAFKDYGTGAGTDVDAFNGGSLTNNAAAVLTALGSAYKGPSTGGTVTASELFRGVAVGDLVGPYVSQFWWLPNYHIFQDVEQPQFVPIAQAREFGVAWTDFVAIQNGTVPKAYDNTDFSGQRLIIDGRDGATAVHSDGPGQFFFNAVNILLKSGFPLDPSFPYQDGSTTNEEGFVTMMVGDIYSAVLDGCEEALKHAWAHKWLGNRKLRPEAMSGLIHRAEVTSTNPFNLDSSLFTEQAGIDVLAWINNENKKQESIPNNPLPAGEGNTYLLSLVYPEGSPVHPAYPAGHAVLSGACATIIKAFFDDTKLIHTVVAPVKPDPTDATKLVALPDGEDAKLLTVGGELNKLASNIALSRNFAGVHYRSDGDEGIALGEKVALEYLRDRARVYAEQGFTGFELTKLNGQRVRVTTAGTTNI